MKPFFFSLKRTLADSETPSYHRPFNEDVERRLRRMTSSKAWADYLDLVDAQVNLASEKLLTAPSEETPYIVAEIRGLKKVPEHVTQILRGIEHERIRQQAAADADARSDDQSGFFASPFWNSGIARSYPPGASVQ